MGIDNKRGGGVCNIVPIRDIISNKLSLFSERNRNMLKKPKKPNCTHLYHYSSCDNLKWLEPILLRNELYFPSPSELNDPSEGKPKPSDASMPSIVEFLCEQYVENNPNLTPIECENINNQIIKEAYNAGKEKVLMMMSDCLNQYLERHHRIYSLSKRWDNMNMWAKYSKDHTGYCLEYKNEGLFNSAYEVNYTDEEITMDFTDLSSVTGIFFFYKSTEWSNEEEVRIVTPSSIQPPITFVPALLTRIILGYRITEDNKSQIIEWTGKRTIPLLITQLHYNSYEHKLELVDIN